MEKASEIVKSMPSCDNRYILFKHFVDVLGLSGRQILLFGKLSNLWVSGQDIQNM